VKSSVSVVPLEAADVLKWNYINIQYRVRSVVVVGQKNTVRRSFVDNIMRFIICVILFPFAYVVITSVMFGPKANGTLMQINFGIVIGLLLYFAVRRTED
jgi:hypothetical protein